MQNPKYFILAGETSGDFYGALIIDALYKEYPMMECTAWGGMKMKNTNATVLRDLTDLNEMGFYSIVSKANKYRALLSEAKKVLTSKNITHFIGIDYSGFNLLLAKHCKTLGIKTIQYIAPKTWAYANFRNRYIKKYVDTLIGILPFEADYFYKFQIKCHYFGHPLYTVNHIKSDNKAKFDIGLFPGSREGEIKNILPVMIEIVKTTKFLFLYCNCPWPKTISYFNDEIK